MVSESAFSSFNAVKKAKATHAERSGEACCSTDGVVAPVATHPVPSFTISSNTEPEPSHTPSWATLVSSLTKSSRGPEGFHATATTSPPMKLSEADIRMRFKAAQKPPSPEGAKGAEGGANQACGHVVDEASSQYWEEVVTALKDSGRRQGARLDQTRATAREQAPAAAQHASQERSQEKNVISPNVTSPKRRTRTKERGQKRPREEEGVPSMEGASEQGNQAGRQDSAAKRRQQQLTNFTFDAWSSVPKRPRGRAPDGMEWNVEIGQWQTLKGNPRMMSPVAEPKVVATEAGQHDAADALTALAGLAGKMERTTEPAMPPLLPGFDILARDMNFLPKSSMMSSLLSPFGLAGILDLVSVPGGPCLVGAPHVLVAR
jgi:hypothetical protein